MVSMATAGADTLDVYIQKLEVLRKRYGGNCPVMTDGGDYPEGANSPYYVTEGMADGYRPKGAVVLR